MSDTESTTSTFGRLSAGPQPQLLELLYRPGLDHDLVHVLPWLLRIDAAHVVMLARQGVLAATTAGALLRVNQDLATRLANGLPPFSIPESHRGLYMLYERHYVDQLGPEVGGSAHVARSRNDINATVTRLRLREEVLGLLNGCVTLLSTMAKVASDHLETVMSGFTHYQPAQPTTWAHYLAGLAGELASAAETLSASYTSLNRSPLGSGAGFGTPFPIDPELTARLLGFAGPIDNSLEAVASRSYGIQVLSGAAALGTAFNRGALDLQLWSSNTFRFLALPDNLVSTSSMMPQKRNAFVFEAIRGETSAIVGGLMGLLYGLKSTPFSNSVEVSADATAHFWPAMKAAKTACSLMDLMLAAVQPEPEQMREFLSGAGTTMTALADLLVRDHELSFRGAHESVSRLLTIVEDASRQSPALVAPALERAVATITGKAIHLDVEAIAEALEPSSAVRRTAFGGGSAPDTVRAQLEALGRRTAKLKDETETRGAGLDRAAAALSVAVDSLM